MKHFTSDNIQSLNKIFRLNLINSISGYKSANLIGTKGNKGENLAVISSVIHLGSNPALLGFIMRPSTVERHTLSNIKKEKYYTINAIHEDFTEQAHYTSAKFKAGISEFEKCRLNSEYFSGFQAPFVLESQLKMGMQLEQIIPIEINETAMIIGSVQHLLVAEPMLKENGQLNLNKCKTVCISGLNTYHHVKEIANYPYARVDELPSFG